MPPAYSAMTASISPSGMSTCHYVQQGELELLDRAWDWTVIPFLIAAIEKVPNHEAVLLTIGAAWQLAEDEFELSGDLAATPDLIRRNLERVVAEFAAAQDMSRFDSDLEDDLDPEEGG